MKLDAVKSCLINGLKDVLFGSVDKHTDFGDWRLNLATYFPGTGCRNLPGAACEDEANRIGAGAYRRPGVIDVGDAANLDEGCTAQAGSFCQRFENFLPAARTRRGPR